MVFWRCCTLSIGLLILCEDASFANAAPTSSSIKKSKAKKQKPIRKSIPKTEVPSIQEAVQPSPLEASPSPAEDVERISLPQMLVRAQSSPLINEGIGALLQSAQAKLQQVQMEKWLTTFDLQAFTGVVPDVHADSALRNQNAQQLLFGLDSDAVNDGGWGRLGPFVRAEISAVQPLYTWGKISGYEEMAKRNLQVAQAEKEKQLAELRLTVKRAYYTLQLAQESLKVLNEVRERLKQVQDKVEEILVKGGKNSENVEETDRLKIRVFQADVENRALDAQRGRRAALATLFELAGAAGNWRPDQDNLVAETVQGIEKDSLISTSMRNRPEIKQLDEILKIKTLERQVVRSAYYPTIFLAGQLDYAHAPGRTDVKSPYLSDNFNKFGIGVALGIKQDLGIHRTWNKIKQADAEIQGIRAQKEKVSVFSRLKVDEAFEKAVAAQQAIEINENGFRAARSWLTSTGLSFSLGTSTTKDVLESYAAYFKARVDLLRALFDLNIALADLTQVSGAEVVDRFK